MYPCPNCGRPALTKQTRRDDATGDTRRRFECPAPTCKTRFSTIEKLDTSKRSAPRRPVSESVED